MTLFALIILMGKRVVDNAMCASICKGDWIWTKQQSIKSGDVVLIVDPLEPNKRLLRRVIGLPGQRIEYGASGDILIDKKRIRQMDMGFYQSQKLLQENIWTEPPAEEIKWLTLRNRDPFRLTPQPPVLLKKDEYFLMADNRDTSLDSRWWGPIPKELILTTVIIRFGEPNLWRDRFDFRLHKE